MNKYFKKTSLLLLSLILVLSLLGCSHSSAIHSNINNGEVILHYIDVGQADATLIQGKDFTMLIDCGNRADDDKIIQYLHQQDIDKLDIAVATHAHEDHIGGFPSILKEFPCDKFYISNKTTTTKTYESLLDTLDIKNIPTSIPQVGEKIRLNEEVSVEFLGPLKEYKDLNNSSIPLKMTHGKNSFLFTGDAESGVEEDLIRKWGSSLNASVYQAGHHGSSTSNSEDFMRIVNPETVIISSNKEDVPKYGHPHIETLNYLQKNDISLYRTDKQGTIKLTSNGKSYQITTEKEFSGNLYRK